MTATLWSALLQWSRVGIGTALFLVAARILPLAELGAFATAFAPVRLSQGPVRAAVADAAVVLGTRAPALSALAGLALAASLVLAAGLWLAAPLLPAAVSGPLRWLALVPPIWAVGAVPEGVLRRDMALKALALRSIAAQGIAGGAALWLLMAGAGIWALVVFAVANAGLASGLALLLSGWQPRRSAQGRTAARTLRDLALREGISGLPVPLAQMAVGAVFGLTAAGAFQIAARALQLADSLALAPLRYLALPRLARDPARLGGELERACLVGGWIAALIAGAGPEGLALLVGPKAAAATPLFLALTPMPLIAAATMPVRQALAARGDTRAALALSLLTLAASVPALAAALALSPTAIAAALPVAGAGAAAIWMRRGPARDIAAGALPCALAGPVASAALAVLATRPIAALGLPDPLAAAFLGLGVTAIYAATAAVLRPVTATA